jgi:hypothetical protein
LGSKLDAFAFVVRMLGKRPADVHAYEREQGYPLLKNPVHAHDNLDWRMSAERSELHLLDHRDASTPVRAVV